MKCFLCLGHDRDLLINILSDPEEMSLIRQKLDRLKFICK